MLAHQLHVRRAVATLGWRTHEHRDHFDAALFAARDWSIFAAPGITNGLPRQRVLEFGESARIGDIHVQALKTPHTEHHYSYLVTWHGVRMFFSGDTEDPSTLLDAEDLDVAFVSPWLLATIESSKRRVPARKVVVYHHRAEDDVERAQDAFVPEQGETFEIERVKKG